MYERFNQICYSKKQHLYLDKLVTQNISKLQNFVNFTKEKVTAFFFFAFTNLFHSKPKSKVFKIKFIFPKKFTLRFYFLYFYIYEIYFK